MPITLAVHLCKQRRTIDVTFDNEAQAAAYVKANGHRYAFDENYEMDLSNMPELSAALFPQCEHGLSLQLCYGPGHYPPDL